IVWESNGSPGDDTPPSEGSIQAGPCLLYGPGPSGGMLFPGAKPPMDEPGRCEVWQAAGTGSASRAGRGGGATPRDPGPANLRYLAGGVGSPDWAIPSGWTTELGRYWSHDYAQRIVSDSGAGGDH